MREGIRTAILFALLFFSIGFIIWMQNGVNSNFVDLVDDIPDQNQPEPTDQESEASE